MGMLLRRHKAAQEEPTAEAVEAVEDTSEKVEAVAEEPTFEAASKKTGKTKKKDEADE